MEHLSKHLTKNWPHFKVYDDDEWVLQTVAGYQLELTSTLAAHQRPDNLKALHGSWQRGNCRKTIYTPEFVSQLFLVEKRMGDRDSKGCQLVCEDRMEGIHLFPDLLQLQGLMVKMDLKDAYPRFLFTQEIGHATSVISWSQRKRWTNLTFTPFNIFKKSISEHKSCLQNDNHRIHSAFKHFEI